MFLFFHSDQSKFSEEIVGQIRQHGLNKHFIIIDIDNPSLKIPSFVTCVPMIVDKETKKTFRDDDITRLVNGLLKISLKTEDVPLDAFTPALDHFKGMTDQYSFIEDNPSDERMMSSRIYHKISDGQDPLVPVMTSDGGSKFDDMQYDKFCSQRDRDISNLFPASSGPRQR
jgi:hypothetical protein